MFKKVCISAVCVVVCVLIASMGIHRCCEQDRLYALLAVASLGLHLQRQHVHRRGCGCGSRGRGVAHAIGVRGSVGGDAGGGGGTREGQGTRG